MWTPHSALDRSPQGYLASQATSPVPLRPARCGRLLRRADTDGCVPVSEAFAVDLQPQQICARVTVDAPHAPRVVVGVIPATDAGSAIEAIAASVATRRSSAIPQNTSTVHSPSPYTAPPRPG